MRRPLLLGLAALALTAPSAAAQLNYDRTFFITGLGDPDRWSRNSTPSRLGARINLGPAGGSREISSNILTSPVDPQSRVYHDIITSNGGLNVLVGHSMGGVISRNLLVNTSSDIATADNIAGIITVGSPHQGAPIVENVKKPDFRGRELIMGFLEEAIYSYFMPLIGIISSLLSALFQWFVQQVLMNILIGIISSESGLGTSGGQDLRVGSPTVVRIASALDSRPHATINGVISTRDAWLVLGASYRGLNKFTYVQKKRGVQNGLLLCKRIFYNFIVKTALGRGCATTHRTIAGMDERWNDWTHGSDKRASFDGLIPTDHSRYPGSAASSSVNRYVGGSDHFSIVNDAGGLSGIETQMLQIGMRFVDGVGGGDPGGGDGGGGGGGCNDPSCIQYFGLPASSARSRPKPAESPRRVPVKRPAAGPLTLAPSY
jgi:pimeloyl-ACP methyl ester carboxylesterase